MAAPADAFASGIIENRVFTRDDLDVAGRMAGLSAFVRVKNGADFIEQTIATHIAHFDEIVVVHAGCTDATPDILARLSQTHGSRLRVFHYAHDVFPPGSTGHRQTHASDPRSMVNYSNAALCMTRYRTVTKLDDDHLAREPALGTLVARLRRQGGAGSRFFGFSGLNLVRTTDGLAIPAADPISGSGDIGFFDVTRQTFFSHDPRYERAPGRGLPRVFAGFVYWHLKYLKTGGGFANYDLANDPGSRFNRKKATFDANTKTLLPADLADRSALTPIDRLAGLFSAKKRFLNARNAALATEDWPQTEAALLETLAESGLRD